MGVPASRASMTPRHAIKGSPVKSRRRDGRGPAEPEIRNPRPEIRNKSQFTGMGEWKNGKPKSLFAGCEQSRLLQCRAAKPQANCAKRLECVQLAGAVVRREAV